MPYSTVADLPPAVRAKLKGKRLRQWMHVFNSSYDKHGDEERAFAEAWATAQKAIGKAATMSEFQFFLPIAKLDKEKRIVAGYASTPTKDADGEIVTLEAIKGALPDYMRWRNIREMHKLSAVGTAEEANIDTKGLYLTAKIVDDEAWKKCLEGVYKGFSIGGRKLDTDGNKVTKIEMTEISVVDRPANPDASFTLAKSADASAAGYLLKAKEKKTTEQRALRKMAKTVALLAKEGPPAAHDGFSLPANVQGAEVSPKDARPNENETRKGDGPKPCEKHGKIGCTECVAKVEAETPAEEAQETTEEDADTKKKERKAKKLAKKLLKQQLEKALGVRTEANFLELRRPAKLNKSMNTAGSLAYCFDNIRGAQRSLLMEGKREGGDSKDKTLAKELGSIAQRLAGVISLKATHEGEEATTLTDADDQYLTSLLGEDFDMEKVTGAAGGTGDPLTDAVLALVKRAGTPSPAQRMAQAKDCVTKARKAAKEARSAIEEAHKMHKAAYIAKAAKKDGKDDGEFDHAGAMEKLQKAFGAVQKALDFGKAAKEQIAKAERAGQSGQETGDGNEFYQVPAGVKDLSPSALAGASPGGEGSGSQPPMYPVDGSVFPGKAAGSVDLRKYAKDGHVPTAVTELLLEKARTEGELEALRRMPAAGAGGRRPYAFDPNKIVAGQGQANPALNKALFDGVDMAAIGSGDERAHTQEAAKVIGNFFTSGHFGKSIIDPSFKGAAGTSR